jgi:hydroxymethylglutaryl-CoA lyase
MSRRLPQIVEVGPRDGLQNESVIVATADKVALIGRMIDAGARRLEVASFVNPARVPQMADAEGVLAALPKRDDVIYVGLVLNGRGLDRALNTQVDEIGVVAVATDAFGLRNQKQTWRESVEVSVDVIERARKAGLRAQATISVAFGCPFEGEVPLARVVEMARGIAKAGPHEIAVADTVGVGVPAQVKEMIAALREAVPGMPLRCHFHNTRNTGLANAFAAAEMGVDRLDASVGGIGGCPFAPSATGNIGTEDLIYMLHRSGFETGYDLAKLNAMAPWLAGRLNLSGLAGMVCRSVPVAEPLRQ